VRFAQGVAAVVRAAGNLPNGGRAIRNSPCIGLLVVLSLRCGWLGESTLRSGFRNSLCLFRQFEISCLFRLQAGLSRIRLGFERDVRHGFLKRRLSSFRLFCLFDRGIGWSKFDRRLRLANLDGGLRWGCRWRRGLLRWRFDVGNTGSGGVFENPGAEAFRRGRSGY
jgi:hypothetical protein